jgi:hypothetical protein
VVLDIKGIGKGISIAGHTVSSHPGVGMGVAFGKFANDAEQVLKDYIAHLASQPRTNESLGVFH